MKAKNFNGCLRCRLGKLDGIRSSAFPADNQPKGNGLYADNVWLKGTFVLMTGEDILTRFEITEGKIHSAVEGLRKEIREDQSYLDNSSFADGMDKWKTGGKATLFTLGGRWIWANGGPYGTKPDGHAEIRTDGKVPYAYIRNNYIMQRLKDFRLIPEYRQTNSQGERVPGVVYLSFSYRVIKAGKLKIEFVNADKTGFENFNMFGHEEDLPVGGEKMFTLDGLWNGTGDFKLSFTGVIYISLLVFSTNKADALAYKYRTLFEQSDRLVKISAAVFDKDGEALKETGLVVKPEGAGLYAQDASGKVALIGVCVEDTDEQGNPVSKIKLTADNIQLEGLVTANGNFNILEDGSIETSNAKIYGSVYAYDGKIGGFTLESGRLYWKAGDYLGNDSRSLKLGISNDSMEGVVDVSFNAATQGRFGVKSVGSNPGGAAIYASSKSDGQTFPVMGNTYAGYFDGGVHVNGAVYCGDILSNNFGTGWTLGNDGTYSYRKGVTGNFKWSIKSESGMLANNYNLEVVNGIVVSMKNVL